MWKANNTNTSNGRSDVCELKAESEMVGHAIFLSVVLALTVLGNFLVVGTVMTYQKLRTVTNYFVISLAVSDVFVGFITLPLKVKFFLMANSDENWSTDMKYPCLPQEGRRGQQCLACRMLAQSRPPL